MERQKVKRKLNMIKVDMDTRAMLATNQQKMCVQNCAQCTCMPIHVCVHVCIHVCMCMCACVCVCCGPDNAPWKIGSQ